MKFTCNQSDLMESLNTVQKAVSQKSSIAALEGVYIIANQSEISIKGYNLEMGIETTIQGEVSIEGNIVINAKMLCDIIRNLPDDIIEMEVDEKYLTKITCGLTQFTVLGMPGDEFPEMPEVQADNSINIKRELFKKIIRKTLFAVSVDETRGVHMGTLFMLDNDKLKAVSFDGYRLAITEETIENKDNISLKFIVPGKTLSEIMKIINEDDNEMIISLTKKHILFENENIVIISRLLEGEFSNYEKSIPKNITTEVIVDTSKLIESIERASLMISDKIKPPVRMSFEYDVIKISCTTALGKVYDEIPTKVEGEKLEIGINNRYMLDSLKASNSDQIKIEMTTPLSPMVVKPIDSDEFLYLIAPAILK